MTLNQYIKTETDDMYQQEHPIESEELVDAKLSELDSELEKITDKANLQQALDDCPDLVSRKEKLQFLRCEVFNADLAAKRMVAYWDKRVEIFGTERAFLPLTQAHMGEAEKVALGRGFARILPEKVDPGNRNILFIDPSRQDRSRYSTEEMTRAVWYAAHVALEDEETQKKGLIVMAFPHHAKLGQFDRKLIKNVISSIRGCLPVRLSALHFCHPPAFFQLVFPLVKVLLGSRLRKRINIHFGSQEHVLARLEKNYGLSRDKLPSDLGGGTDLDHEKWIEDQRQKEGK